MRMFRSFRNPISKAGRTTNTTGSRIRSSVRTLRENSASLVEAARARARQTAPAQGYSAATASRSSRTSADYAGENARKKAYNAGSSRFEQRQARYQATKSAPAPAGSSIGYRAGYAVGRQAAAGKYKANLTMKASTTTQVQRPFMQGGTFTKTTKTGRTGLENQAVRRTSLVARREATDAYRAGASVAKEAAQTAAVGAKQVARTAVRGGKVAAKAAQATYSAGQKVVFGSKEIASGIGRGFKYAYHGQAHRVRGWKKAARNGTSWADRRAAPINAVAEKGYGLVAKAGSAAILGAGRGISKLAGAASNVVKNRQYVKARQAWNIANPQKPSGANFFVGRGIKTTPMGKNAVVAGFKYQQAMAQRRGNRLAAKAAAAAAANPAPTPAPAPKQARFAVGTKSGQAASAAVRPIARARQANALRMQQQGFTRQQVIQAAQSNKRGGTFTQKPAGAAAWGNKAAPNWSAFQPGAGGQNQPPVQPTAQPAAQAAPAMASSATVASVRAKVKLRQNQNSNPFGLTVGKVRQKQAAAEQLRTASAFRSMRDDPGYNQPIVSRGATITAPVTQAPASTPQALIPEVVAPAAEPAKRGRGRPKLTPEQAEAARIKRNQARVERRKRTGK